MLSLVVLYADRLFASIWRSVEHLLIDASAVYPVCSCTWWAHVMPTHGSTLSPRCRFREGSSRMKRQVSGQGRSFLGVEFETDIRFVQMGGTPVTQPLIVFFHPIHCATSCTVTSTFHDVREKLPLVTLRYACGSLFNPIRLGSSRSHASVQYSLNLATECLSSCMKGVISDHQTHQPVPAPTPNNQTLVLCDVLHVVVPVLCLGRLGERREAERVIGPLYSRFLFSFFFLFSFSFSFFFSFFLLLFLDVQNCENHTNYNSHFCRPLNF